MECKGEWDDDSFEGLAEMEGGVRRGSGPSEGQMACHPVTTCVGPRSAPVTKKLMSIVFLDLFYILAPDPFKYNFS